MGTSVSPCTEDPAYVQIPIVIIDDNYKLKLTPAFRQGLSLVHFSAQPEPFLSLKLHETTQCVRKECSRPAEKWTSVSPCVPVRGGRGRHCGRRDGGVTAPID